ncbi:LuxR C-terminal-related transcriptional regulator [Lentzea sp. BCCO 10_0798]|uniref:LuxR C-terminal-related transcriptional regulator n=1 Tax=Lentzea kristufekii TaxID=3095430 RepID=A0ABU4U0J8_9PSEU|nr:LuxR C-terminal-related transcriptional regulator [Lentzea sp. BCCO 10_0798]MDX8054093.1 LuxR C-terminal-related transcriptional regulator [Lentzea sp. BCCO 10_0798]
MDLQAASDVIRAPLSETLSRLSAAIAGAIPHQAVAELSNCSFAPFKLRGEAPVTITDIAALRPLLPDSGAWQGRAVMAGADVPVVVLVSDVSEPSALLVLLRTDDTPVAEEVLAPAVALWNVVTAYMEGMRNEAVPATLAVSRAAAAARAVAISDLGDAYGASLAALLGVLRDHGVDDATARSRSVDLAVTALVELRSRAELDRAQTEERVGEAFERLAESLRRVMRGRDVRLDLGTPGAEEGADRIVPTGISATAAAVVRSAVHAMLDDQGGVGRVHIGWRIVGAVLRATVRDDGPGTLSCAGLDRRRVPERLGPLGGKVEVDAVPGWGATVTIEVPLGPPESPREDPLTVLGARELEVLGRLARGRRNRDIAGELHISESTVKFHVAKILEKLGVGSRGEAAALAHEWGATTR